MATQIIHVDLRADPAVLRVRDDVQALFVVVTDDDRPVDVRCVPRPADGVFRTESITGTRDAVSRPVTSGFSRTSDPPDKGGPHMSRPASAGVGRPASAGVGRPASAGPRIRLKADPTTVVKPELASTGAIPLASIEGPVGTGRVSVIVPTRERPDDLARCLESLAHAERDGHEVIVVDNAPTTTATRLVVDQFGARYILEPDRGLNRARNAGVAAASHELVAFVDDDVVVSRRWLTALCACFEHPEVSAATGLVLPLELETAAQEQFEVYSAHRRVLRPRVYSREVLWPAAAGEIGMGANMAFRRDAVLGLGGFDLRLGPPARTRAGDEIDLFARLLDAGGRIAYTPDAYVWHRHRRTTSEMRSCAFGYGVGTFSMLTKRVVERRDAAALMIAAWWLVGPLLRVARAKIGRRPAPPWSVVLSESAGAAIGPFCFGYEAWRARSRSLPVLSPRVEH